ncbi:MAG: SGNH/GDSL hydrolase family protein [Verrucomicrobiales bacterium]|nr:SGNH/GDSL hydrolase family protein [Verrucomicrobiales bacterium]MCP5557598.1 SGNH/GDSL hydrolase family protein [Verrucomicrobiaceae bacterium]
MRILLALLFASGSLLTAAPLKTAQLLAACKEPVRIVCIGDSITGVYYHTGGLRAYPEMLQIALQKIYPQAQLTVRNAGVSGDTTIGALKRLDRDVLAHNPHLVTVMFGMNDLVRSPVADFKKNLVEIITRCRNAGAEVVLCTQNSIVETPARPVAKLAEFTQAIHDVAVAESITVADCFRAFEEVRSRSALEWNLLHSDTIHPNMDGHKLFAERIAQTISGQTVSLNDIGPPTPAMPHTFEKLKTGQPVKVLAMPPYDKEITPALRRLFPKAVVEMMPWQTKDQSLSQLEQSAKGVRALSPDLVVIAVPGSLSAATPEAFHQSYSWVMNWALSFGPRQWDVIVALPSAIKADLSAEERQNEDFARRLIRAQDLPMIEGSAQPFPALLDHWLSQQLTSP